jgi:hypothetical protein
LGSGVQRSNVQGWPFDLEMPKDGIASLNRFLEQTEYIHSTFDVGRSMLISLFFVQTDGFSDQRWR